MPDIKKYLCINSDLLTPW